MKIGSTKIACKPLCFALQYRCLDGGAPHRQGAGGAGGNNPDQGVCIQVVGTVDGQETELLRFDCFDSAPHYHYGPEHQNVRVMLDPTTDGNPIRWTMQQLATRLPDMLKRAGYAELAVQVDTSTLGAKLTALEQAAGQMAVEQRDTVTHNRGTDIIDAGNLRFGLEMRTVGQDGGMAIHVLSDVAGQEIELLAFDCFRTYPHYHYGPRNRNERIFWDTTLIPDTLQWTLDQFTKRRLPAMLTRAGYPTIAAALDEERIAAAIPQIEARTHAMLQASQA